MIATCGLAATRVSLGLAFWILGAQYAGAQDPDSSQQVRGRVLVAGTESPLADVLVELWSSQRLLSWSRTDQTGQFSVRAGPTAGTATLLARRMGFAAARVESVRSGAYVVVAMQEVAIPLPELVVTTCPGQDDSTSRRLWREAIGHYELVPDSVGVWAGGMVTRFRRTSADSVGFLGAGEQEWAGQGGGTGLTSRHWRERVATRGYALPRRQGRYQGTEYGLWEYMQLESMAAEHFADSLFGQLHVLLAARDRGGFFEIPFCPRSTGRPEIEGAITLSPHGGLVNAWWRFVLRRESEQAGGEVTFAPLPDSGRSFVIPIRGVLWRRPRGSVLYLHWAREYSMWGVDWNLLRRRAPH